MDAEGGYEKRNILMELGVAQRGNFL